MQKNKKTTLVFVAVALVFGAAATFGYSLLVQNVAGASAQRKSGSSLLEILLVLVFVLAVVGAALFFTKSIWLAKLEQKAPLLAAKLHARKSASQANVTRQDVDTTVVITPDKKQ